MAYNEQLANRIREALMDQPRLEEKKMFQGLCFMVNDKMCVCVRNDVLLCRIGEQQAEQELEKGNCREMIHNGRRMKDYVYVDMDQVQALRSLDSWITLALQFNSKANSSKKRKT
jgi:TfoX/Sxy family transcriptional regulator of competence genes